MAALNYAKEYQQALEQEFPYVLYFGALFATPNNGRYRWVNSNVIEIPTITTTGRVDGDRDTIGQKKRNYNNSWTPLQVTNHRTWSTLVHPRDIQETNQVASIANITRVFNEEQKFPEMNCYLISKLYADYTAKSKTADQTVLTTDNVLDVFDKMMTAMDNRKKEAIESLSDEVKSILFNEEEECQKVCDKLNEGLGNFLYKNNGESIKEYLKMAKRE